EDVAVPAVGPRHRREKEAERGARPEAHQRHQATAHHDQRRRAPADAREAGASRLLRRCDGHDSQPQSTRRVPPRRKAEIGARARDVVGKIASTVPWIAASIVFGRCSSDRKLRRILSAEVLRPRAVAPKRILLISASIWRMAGGRGGAGIWPMRVLYFVLLEMRITRLRAS